MARPHLGALYRTALRMTRQREAAEDLVQDTCLKAFRAFAAAGEVANGKGWLLRIMMNAHIDNVRRRATNVIFEHECAKSADDDGEALHLLHAASGADPETGAHGRAFYEHLLRAIDDLSPDIRAVVVLAILEECRYDEIADILATPIGTVRSRLSRGRQLLQAALVDFAPPESVKPLPQSTHAALAGGRDD